MSTSDFSSLGIAVGHATDGKGATGLTVIRPVDGTTAWRGAAAIVGRATATREVPTVAVDHISKRIDAILLTGGSAYGLDAAAGVMRWMEERGRGFPIAGGVVPIVPAAAVFDLAPLGRFDSRPSPQMAYDACDRASTDDIAEGSVGAGTGCTVGKAAGRNYAMKGGVGCAIEQHGDVSVAAIAVVNAFGDVRDAEGKIIAGARDADGRWLDSASIIGDAALGVAPLAVQPDPQTTLCVIATNAVYTGAELQQLARASSAALHRRITPAGTSFDGDIVFAICPQGGDGPVPALPGIEVIAARTLETAIERAVRLAKGREGIPGLAD